MYYNKSQVCSIISLCFRISNSPHGPSAKFLVQNSEFVHLQSWSVEHNICCMPCSKRWFYIIVPFTVHTLAELKMTGNCLKGSRPLLSFDPVSSTRTILLLWQLLKCGITGCEQSVCLFLLFYFLRNLTVSLTMPYWRSSSPRCVYKTSPWIYFYLPVQLTFFKGCLFYKS